MPRKKKELPNRPDGRYELKVTIGKNFDGTLIRKSFYSSISKEDARKQAEEYKIEMEVANRTGVGFISRDIDFSDWAVKWMETYKKPDVTENTYHANYWVPIILHLNPYFKDASLSDIQPINIKQFYVSKQNLSISVLSKIRICLNGIFESGIDNALCAKNPARGITFTSTAIKHNKQVYSDVEIEIVEAIASATIPEIIILLETGLRKGELLALTWEDINFKEEVISVNHSIAYQRGNPHGLTRPPKKDSYRTNPLSIRALKTLSQMKSQQPLSRYVFPDKTGLPQNPVNFAQKIRYFMNTLPPNLPRLTAHELRHTYGTYLRRQGVDIYTIQKIMGHKDIRMTTEIYVHNEIDALKTALSVIDGGACFKEQLS